MRESEILKHCLLAAAESGAYAWRNNRGMFMSIDGKRRYRAGLECKGASDIIGLYKGRFLAIECKTEKGRLSQDQKKFLDLVRSIGGIAFTAKCADDVKKGLDGA